MRLINLLFVIILSAALISLYKTPVLYVVGNWATPDGSHGPLILAVSIYLLWLRKNEIRQLRPEPALFSGGLLLFAGGFVYFSGVISSTLLVQVVSIVPVLLGIILLLGGTSFFRIFFLPVGYLFFLTGFIEQIMGSFAIYFQNVSAWIAAMVLRLGGMPVFLESTIIDLPHISLEVVRACSGISHIVALFALAVPLAYLTQKTLLRKVILVFSALFIGLFANGLRIVLIALFTRFFPDAGVHGPYETFRVAVIFFFGLVLLVLLSRVLDRKAVIRTSETNGGLKMETTVPRQKNATSLRKQRAAFLIAVIVVGSTLAFTHFYIPAAVELQHPLKQFPNRIAGFAGKEYDGMDERFHPFPADEELFRRYEDGNGNIIDLYIGYFGIQDRRRKIIDYRRAWMHEQSRGIKASSSQNTLTVNHMVLRDGMQPSDVYFWYQVGGRIVRDQYSGKALTFLNGLLKRKTNAAIVIVLSASPPEDVMPVVAELAFTIRDYLPGT